MTTIEESTEAKNASSLFEEVTWQLLKQLVRPKQPESADFGPGRISLLPARRAGGMVRLLGLSGIAMALVLPIGIYPRIMQSQELDRGHDKIVEELPQVSVARPLQATASIAR